MKTITPKDEKPGVSPAAAQAPPDDMARFRGIRSLIWLYVVMLLFEGAFRKWITPGLSSPLLIIRDPVVILIYIMALAQNVFPFNRFISWLAGIAVLTAIAGLFAETFNPLVYAFGLRTNFLHLPLIFVIAKVMTRQHVISVGRIWLILAVPMAFLIVRQFEGGADSILNTTAGGTGVQINTSGMKIRASGTFSYVSGLVSYCSVTAAFLLYGLVDRKAYSVLLLLAGAASLVISVSTSGSRSALGAVGAVSAVGLCAVMMKPQMLLRTLLGLAVVGVIGVMVMQVPQVSEGVDVMQMRFDEAAGAGENFWARAFGSFYRPLYCIPEAPWFGYGLGSGTNAGSAIATGRVDFSRGEDDWSRVILESGPIVGLLFLGWRVALVIFLGWTTLRALKTQGPLPVFLFGASLLTILNGQWGQPTMLGFAALGGGLCLAAVNPESAVQPVPENRPDATANLHRPLKRRGRSVYAEALHGKG